MIARNYKEGVRPPFTDSVGGALGGHGLVWDAPTTMGDHQAKLPTGTTPHLLAPAGINESRGTVGSSSGTSANEVVSTCRQGLTTVRVSNGQTVARGAAGELDPDTLGNVRQRTAYSRSGYALGTFEEGLTLTEENEVEFYAQPQLVELVRPVMAGCTGAITAATKYLGDPSQAKAAAQAVRYIARFTGETVRNLAVNLLTAPGGSDTVVVTVQKSSDNGATWSDTALTCTITGTAKAASDLTHAVTLTAGDLLAFKVVSSAGTAADAVAICDVT